MIDCPPEGMEAGVDFWGKALNMPPRSGYSDSNPYVFLQGRAGRFYVVMQRVEDEARVHRDFETDDVEAEVRRLEALGARRKEQMGSFWIMERRVVMFSALFRRSRTISPEMLMSGMTRSRMHILIPGATKRKGEVACTH